MTCHGRERKVWKTFLDVSNIMIHYNFNMYTLGLLGLLFDLGVELERQQKIQVSLIIVRERL
jgi:hypothetical protein